MTDSEFVATVNERQRNFAQKFTAAIQSVEDPHQWKCSIESISDASATANSMLTIIMDLKADLTSPTLALASLNAIHEVILESVRSLNVAVLNWIAQSRNHFHRNAISEGGYITAHGIIQYRMCRIESAFIGDQPFKKFETWSRLLRTELVDLTPSDELVGELRQEFVDARAFQSMLEASIAEWKKHCVELAPSQLAKIFNVSGDTISRRLKSGQIDAKCIHEKLYSVHENCLPDHWRQEITT